MKHSTVYFRRGIFFLMMALFIFSLLNALVKDAVSQYNPIQLVFFRTLFAALPSGIFLLMRGRVFPSPWPVLKFHLLRAGLVSLGLMSLFLGIGQLSLSDSMALYFSSFFSCYFFLSYLERKSEWDSVGRCFYWTHGDSYYCKTNRWHFSMGESFSYYGSRNGSGE